MMSTQEPNTMAPQSALCINLLEKMASKIDRSSIFWDYFVELFGPVFLKLREARRNEAFHTIIDFTLLHVLSRNSK